MVHLCRSICSDPQNLIVKTIKMHVDVGIGKAQKGECALRHDQKSVQLADVQGCCINGIESSEVIEIHGP